MGIQPYQYEEMRRRTERNTLRDPVKGDGEAVKDEILELHAPIIGWCKHQTPVVPFVHSDPTKKTHATRGTPDFIIGYRGKTFWIECKAEGGEFRPAQTAFIKMLADQNIVCAIITNMEQFYELMR